MRIVRNNEPKAICTHTAKEESYSHIAISEEGKIVAVVTGKQLQFFNVAEGRAALIEKIELIATVESMEWNSDLLYVTYNNGVTLFNKP